MKCLRKIVSKDIFDRIRYMISRELTQKSIIVVAYMRDNLDGSTTLFG